MDGHEEPQPVLNLFGGAWEPFTRGKLTIFFGAGSGVERTRAMVEAARLEARRKRDVLVGVIDVSRLRAPESQLSGLGRLAPAEGADGPGRTELDLDAVFARRPELVVVDDLAHGNATGARHPKRYQDVVELLDAGIEVLTTLDVQQLEGVGDVVAQITGSAPAEVVPDWVFDRAHEVRLVDQEEHARAAESPENARDRALDEDALLELRELAFRRTAERIQAQLRVSQTAHRGPVRAGERVLVCATADSRSARVIREARRMATSLHAEFVGVHVETPDSLRLSPLDRARLAANLRLVESLGGEAVVLRAQGAAAETVRYARERHVTRIVVSKPPYRGWRGLGRRSFLGEIVRESREIDVHAVSGEPAEELAPQDRGSRTSRSRISDYVAGTSVVVASTLIAWFGFGYSLADAAMLLLLGVVVVSMRFGYGPSLLAAVLSVASFEFFFIPPHFSFAVANLRHVATFLVMLFVGLVVSSLTQRIRHQADTAQDRERRTASLYALSREIALADSRGALLDSAARHLGEVFRAKVGFLLPDEAGNLALARVDEALRAVCDSELTIARWSQLNDRPAGAGTDTHASAQASYVPLKGSHECVGVLALSRPDVSYFANPDERQLLATFATLVGAALERTKLADEARGARLRIETEQLRNALLSSVSHDLRTPLAVVTGATTALLEPDGPKDERTRRRLLETAHQEAVRLDRLLRNLLEMTRLGSGALRIRKEPQPLEEVVGAALNRLDEQLEGRQVVIGVPFDLPFVPFDPVLIEQVLINLVENAIKYTPPRSPIEVSARVKDGSAEVEVADRGPGVAPQHTERIFDKFFRANEREGGGFGLGLTVCRGIVTAHGGRIWVEPRSGGGASFKFTLPPE